MDSVVIKLCIGDHVHRIRLSGCTMSELSAAVMDVAGLDGFITSYVDDEGDCIVVRTDADLAEAVTWANEVTGKALKLTIAPKEDNSNETTIATTVTVDSVSLPVLTLPTPTVLTTVTSESKVDEAVTIITDVSVMDKTTTLSFELDPSVIPVDKKCEDFETYCVLRDHDNGYSAVLAYPKEEVVVVLQLLQSVFTGHYCVWKRWFSASSAGAMKLDGPIDTITEAVAHFTSLFSRKTGVEWSLRALTDPKMFRCVFHDTMDPNTISLPFIFTMTPTTFTITEPSLTDPVLTIKPKAPKHTKKNRASRRDDQFVRLSAPTTVSGSGSTHNIGSGSLHVPQRWTTLPTPPVQMAQVFAQAQYESDLDRAMRESAALYENKQMESAEDDSLALAMEASLYDATFLG